MEAHHLRSMVLSAAFAAMISSGVISLLWFETVELSESARYSDLYGLGHVLIVFCVICMALSTITIFLNKMTVVRNNLFLSLLSFFLAPLLVSLFFFVTIFDKEEMMLFGVMLVSFHLPLAFYFARYRKLLTGQQV
ncbi:hypothetical protein [Chitinophaga qingshengii]|uniref:Uncharacterized protein n=1 Tax=Chitinophaga qingshengii TaxID=1569794 RepID=A0ABR7TKA0_9BACT|nr:hypothetical protein [Chitinophaga qingshengii]MBC9930916.1 hypothetical protein [Chitinophaga qingshengii]